MGRYPAVETRRASIRSEPNQNKVSAMQPLRATRKKANPLRKLPAAWSAASFWVRSRPTTSAPQEGQRCPFTTRRYSAKVQPALQIMHLKWATFHLQHRAARARRAPRDRHHGTGGDLH